MVTFSVAAMVFVMLLFVASISVAVARESTLKLVRTSGSSIKRWGGRVIIGVGSWFLVTAVLAPLISDWLVG